MAEGVDKNTTGQTLPSGGMGVQTTGVNGKPDLWPTIVAWLPILLLVALIAVFYWLDIGVVYESQAMLTTLNVLFCSSISFLVVYLAARSYLATGSRAVVLLGCGALIFAVINLLAGILVTDPNVAITLYGTGVCLAGLCFLGSAFWAVTQKPREKAPAKARTYLGLNYLGVLCFMCVIILGAMAGATPLFFVPGQGSTLLRHVILDLTVAEFILASVCFGTLYRRSRTPFLLWYSLGLLLIGMGMGILIFVSDMWSLVSWAGRGGQYLGGLYMLVAVWSLTKGGDMRIPLEKALEESEEKHRTIAETANEGIWMADTEGRTTFINNRMAEMLGYSPGEMIGKPAFDFMDEEARAIAKQNLERRRQGIRDSFEQKYIRKDGSTLWAIVSATPLLDKDGRVTATMGMLTDITERKQAEEALRESEEKYRTIVETAKEGIWTVDAEGKTTFVNSRMAEMLGVSREDLLGKGVSAFTDEEGMTIARRNLERRKQGIKESHEYKYIRKDGSTLWAIVSSTPLLGSDGKFAGSMSMITDITERKQAETALKQNQQRLDDILRSIQDGFFEIDSDWRFTYINQRAARNGDFEPEELIGECIWEKFPYMVGTKFESVYREVMETRRPVNFEIQAATRNVWYDISIYPSAAGITGYWKDVTERKRAEEALREKDTTMQALFNAITESLVLTDSAGIILAINETAAKRLGQGAKELVGMRLFSALGNAGPSKKARADEVRRTGKPVRFEDVRNGKVVDQTIYPIFSDDGQIARFAIFGHDITERKEMEDKIRESEERYRSLFKGMSEGFALHEIICDERGIPADYRFLDINPAFERFTGLKREEVVGMRKSEVLPGDDPYWLEIYGNVALTGEPRHFEEYSTALDRCYEVFAYRPAPLQFAVIFLDVTDRKRMEEALRESQSRLEAVFTAIPDAIIVYDASGRPIKANEAAINAYGFGPRDLTRDSAAKKLQITHMDGRSVSLSDLPTTRALQGNVVIGEQFRFVDAQGKKLAIMTYAAPLLKDGEVNGAVALWHDITELESARESLKLAKDQAELYLDLMGHDLNNMHQIAVGYLELARESLELDTSEQEFIDKPMEVMQRSAKLIDNVRKLQRVQAGNIEDNTVDLGDVLKHVVNEYRDVAGGAIVYNNGIGPRQVMANELLHDVFSNLVSNAIKHSGEKGANITVNVDTIQENGRQYFRVHIEDNGPGIKDSMKDKIFNRLHRGETKARGMGLGLYLVKSLVDSYHGRVWVEDRVPGDHTKGSRFVVMLPAIMS